MRAFMIGDKMKKFIIMLAKPHKFGEVPHFKRFSEK